MKYPQSEFCMTMRDADFEFDYDYDHENETSEYVEQPEEQQHTHLIDEEEAVAVFHPQIYVCETSADSR